MNRRTIATATAVALTFATGAATLHAATLTFNRLVDSTVAVPDGSAGNFTAFDAPVIDGSTIAFAGGNNSDAGIYTWSADGTFKNIIVERGDSLPGGWANPGAGTSGPDTFISFSGPSLDSDGTVAFNATGAQNLNGIYVGTGAAGRPVSVVANQLTTIPTTAVTFNGGDFDEPSIDAGRIAFYGEGGGNEGIYTTVSGGGLAAVVTPGAPVPGRPPGDTFVNIRTLPANHGSTTLFLADAQNLSQPVGNYSTGVYLDNNGTRTLIADSSTVIPDDSLSRTFTLTSEAALSNDGHVAFTGGTNAGGPASDGVYTNVGGSLQTVANLSTPVPNQPDLVFSQFNVEPLSIDGDRVLFAAGLRTSGGTEAGHGLYLWEDGVLTEILRTSEMLDGLAIVDFELSDEALSGSIATFQVTFFGGSEAIYTVTIPEPATGLLILLGLGCLALPRRIRLSPL